MRARFRKGGASAGERVAVTVDDEDRDHPYLEHRMMAESRGCSRSMEHVGIKRRLILLGFGAIMIRPPACGLVSAR